MNKEDMLRLDSQLCFSIYACSREVIGLYRPLLDALEITYPQYLVLLVLWEQKQSTVKELGKKLYLDSGTLTPMLKRMEANGLVNRFRSKEDERTVLVSLTEKGETLKEKAYCIPEELIAKSGLTVEETKDMLRRLQALLGQLHNLKD
ncbi:MarR family transcriptional regulator [Shimazuella sp. AN120528]|uniref:MarR family winged helix-turn-helix transcriptional regulator n=1 Tax=Shimazuella soli TaxID=1892854 RepID=UPI001F0E75C0|nr:MarR family transcriptional regulator [Shimazuella soli]MCH5585773.1 MarR family transcriptional regulator [Shimazuella soli]